MTTLEALADRLSIQDVLCRYARGIDRCDEAVLQSVWWPGTLVDYGSGPTDAGAWSTTVLGALRAMRLTQHFLGNMLIDIDGTIATAETYCHAFHEVAVTDGLREMAVGGRYLDRLEKRGDEWRIAARRYVIDWNRNAPSTALWDDPLYVGLTRHGARAPDDPLYTGA